MSNLPKQLQRQQEELTALEADMQTAPKPEEITPESQQPVEPTPTPTPSPTPAPSHPDTQELDAARREVDEWKHKYRTLEGKYRAEVPRLNAQVQQVQDQLTQLQAKLEQPKVEPPKPAPVEKLVTDKDKETFGADLVDLIKRQAEEIARPQINQLVTVVNELQTKNAELVSQLTGVTKQQGQTAQEQFFAALAQQVPDWHEINASHAFLEWLGGVEPLAGVTRQELLDNATGVLDARRTATILNAFKAQSTPAAQPQPPVQQPQQIELQQQVQPPRSPRVAPNVPTNPADRIWTVAEMEGFYADVRRGKYANNPAEQQRIEQEIDLAVVQNRLR